MTGRGKCNPEWHRGELVESAYLVAGLCTIEAGRRNPWADTYAVNDGHGSGPVRYACCSDHLRLTLDLMLEHHPSVRVLEY